MQTKPTRYVVRYCDDAAYEKAVERVGGNPDHLEDFDHWREKDFEDLTEAKAFADSDAIGPEGACITERRNIRFEYPFWECDEVDL